MIVRYNPRVWVKSLADAGVTCGGKAHNLARLIAAGLPVPDGFAIEATARAARDAIPDDVIADVVARAAKLGEVIARSSATIEDGETGAAAGVFESIVATGDVWDAIRAVWDSALAPLAVGYARGRVIALGVVVQRRVIGRRITVYTRAPDDGDGEVAWIQREGEPIERIARGSRATLLELALRAEVAIGAAGADVEIVDDGALWVVQARPIVRASIVRRPPPPMILAPLVVDGRRWRWDAAHNPAPLSPAQAGLVARVEAAGVAPWAMRVCGGYLYTTPRGEVAAVSPPRDAAELATRVAVIEARLAATLEGATGSLDDAIERYLAHYAIWANELAPLVAAAVRAHDPARLAAARPSRIRALLEAELDDDRLRAELGDLAPAWDVAVPTYAETWHVVRAAVLRARAMPAPRVESDASELERAAADLAERDDLWFYRAQAMVRRALVARTVALGIDPDDAGWIELDALAHAIDPIDGKNRAMAARAANARAAQWVMPIEATGSSMPTSATLCGIGIGPRVTGRVVRFDGLVVGVGDVVVCQTVTPGLAVVVIGCAAIVSESVHDGLLDHGVALARELGITCVVGCRDAWSRLANGTIVTVDGAAGSVEIVEIVDKLV